MREKRSGVATIATSPEIQLGGLRPPAETLLRTLVFFSSVAQLGGLRPQPNPFKYFRTTKVLKEK